jgi:hypothetical protein
MVDRAREIGKMMGYESLDAILDAVGRGEVILLKIPDQARLDVAQWLRGRIPEVRGQEPQLADSLDDIADGLDLAMELTRYPSDTDVCDLDLPHGWPSYCDKDALT